MQVGTQGLSYGQLTPQKHCPPKASFGDMKVAICSSIASQNQLLLGQMHVCTDTAWLAGSSRGKTSGGSTAAAGVVARTVARVDLLLPSNQLLEVCPYALIKQHQQQNAVQSVTSGAADQHAVAPKPRNRYSHIVDCNRQTMP
jgi:hypothetical protein